MAIPHFLAQGIIKRLWQYRATSFPAPELDHIRYVCMVDDRRSRDELGYAPATSIVDTVRSVELESW